MIGPPNLIYLVGIPMAFLSAAIANVSVIDCYKLGIASLGFTSPLVQVIGVGMFSSMFDV